MPHSKGFAHRKDERTLKATLIGDASLASDIGTSLLVATALESRLAPAPVPALQGCHRQRYAPKISGTTTPGGSCSTYGIVRTAVMATAI